MKKVIASAGLLALGAVGVQTAQAEFAAGAEKPWTIAGTLRGFYDDNYNTEPDGPLRHGSFGFEVRPSASVNYAVGATTLNASYTYSMKYYDDRPGNKADQSHDFEFYLNHAFNERYTLDFEESFVISQEPEVLDRGLSAPLRANGDNIRNNAAVNFHAQLTKLLGIVLGYSNTYYDYTGNAAAQLPGQASYGNLLNRDEQTVLFNTRWQLAEQTVGILGYKFEAVNYLNSGSINGIGLPFFSPKTRDNYSHFAYVGVEHSFRSDLSFSGRAGAQVVDYYNLPSNSNPGTVSPYVDLSLNYTYMDSGTLVVGLSHKKNQTDVSGLDVSQAGGVTPDQESSTLYGSIVQTLTPLSPKLTATLTGQYQNSVYNGGGANGEVDNFYLLGLNFAYQFTKYISGEVGYNYDLLDSQLQGRGYDRNRVYVGVTASY